MFNHQLCQCLKVALLVACTMTGFDANASGNYTLHSNLIYSSAKPTENNLDIYVPNQGYDMPVVVYLHGGGWIGGSKSVVDSKADFYTDQGYIFISMNYRLAPAVKNPAQAKDVARAIAWIYGNIAGYGGNPNRIAISGHSAGAHLVALVATDGSYLAQTGLTTDVIQAVIPMDGGDFDLIARFPELSSMGLKNFFMVFGYQKAIWFNQSPINHVQAGQSIPPFLLIKAEARTDEQDENFADTLNAAGHQASVFTAINQTHPSVNLYLGASGISPEVDAMNQAVLNFLQSVMP